MEKKIVYVRLLTGEELVTTHVNTNADTFTFEASLQIYLDHSDPAISKGKLKYMQWLSYTKAAVRVHINKNSVVLMCDPIEPLVAEYQRVTGKVLTPTPPAFIMP